MTTIPNPDEHTPLDHHARQLHAQALAQVSPRTLARLRDARRTATAADAPRRRPAFAPWLAGGALAASLALAVVLRPGGPTPTVAPNSPAPTVAVAAAVTTATATDPVQSLQEDPGFYLWLDSADATALAME